MKSLISVSTIARNEESVIERFIKSIRENLGDVEIVIIDTGSTDNTVNLGRSLGAKVVPVGDRFVKVVTDEDEEYINNQAEDYIISSGDRIFYYADARNYADSQCSSSWIISLDLHWVITKCADIEGKLRKLKENVKICAYNCVLSGVKFETNRIYRRGQGMWKYQIHEVYMFNNTLGAGMINFSSFFEAIKVEGNERNYIGNLAYHFYKGNYDPLSDEYARLLFYFARDLYLSKKHKNLAIKMLNMCSENKKNWSKERSQATIYLADMFTDKDKRRFYLSYALNIDPGWREPYLRLAENSFNSCDWIGAIGYCERAFLVERQEGPLHVEGVNNYGFLPFNIMYGSYIFLIKNCTESHNFILGERYIKTVRDFEDKISMNDNEKVKMWRQIYTFYVSTRKKEYKDIIKTYLNKCIKVDKVTFLPEWKRIFGEEK